MKLFSFDLPVSKKSRLSLALRILLVLALAGPLIQPSFEQKAMAADVFFSGLETGETQPTWADTVDSSLNIGGYCCGLTAMESSIRTGEQARTGTAALMYSGSDNSATTSYSYNKVFDVNIVVTSDMSLSYWIYPQQTNGKYVAIDFIFTDGSNLRDSGAVDQFGVAVHPTAQGNKAMTINAWNEVRSSFGSVSALVGKTIDRILVAYDQPSNTGQFRGYIDDIKIDTTTATPGRNSKIVSTVFPTDDIVISDFDVTDFGADKTGANDATSAIQQAIDACYNSGGGTVWMPAGTYKVSNTLLVKAFCTVRGDRRDPDSGTGSYGTVISANLASGNAGPALFRIGGSAGVMGLTTFYPNQNAQTPVAYNYTFVIPGRAWIGEENYMMSSVIDVTMLNSYRGIGVSTMASDHGGNVANGQVHETVTIKNVKGTVLYRGAVAYNGGDVGTWEHVKFNNSYWANAGAGYNAPSLTTINNWTRANGIAYTLGDLEWEQFHAIEASDYNIGINIVNGQRIQFAGEILWANIVNTNVAVKVDAIDTRWGMSFLRSVLTGSSYSIQNTTTGFVKVTDSTVTGPTSGTVQTFNPGTSPTSYPAAIIPKVTRAVLYDVSKSPYNAVSTSSKNGPLPTVDATSAIQSALNDAGTAGGGVVYVPAGWYKINTRLSVPANVELRGASSIPHRDQETLSAGSVLFAYEGHNTATPDTAAAFITLNGNTSGARGFRVFYPNNNPQNSIVPYPYTIRANGSSTYVVNVGLPNSYNALDFKTFRNDNHYISRVVGTIFKNGIKIGLSTNGWVENILTNGNAVTRVGYNISGWVTEADVFTKVINAFTRPNEKLVIIDGASNETLLNIFAYGANVGVDVVSGTTVNIFNLGVDNLGTDGYGVKRAAGTVKVMNLMRYNGTTSTGTVTIYNAMNL